MRGFGLLTTCVVVALATTLVESRSVQSRTRRDIPTECPAENGDHTVYIAHETNCAKYYMCNHGEKIEQACASGLNFNAALQVCDWPENAGCTPYGSTDTETESSDDTGNAEDADGSEDAEQSENGNETVIPSECPAENGDHAVYIAHETNCAKYYTCNHGEKIEQACVSGLEFNAALQVCDWPENSGCNLSVSTDATGSGDSEAESVDLEESDDSEAESEVTEESDDSEAGSENTEESDDSEAESEESEDSEAVSEESKESDDSEAESENTEESDDSEVESENTEGSDDSEVESENTEGSDDSEVESENTEGSDDSADVSKESEESDDSEAESEESEESDDSEAESEESDDSEAISEDSEESKEDGKKPNIGKPGNRPKNPKNMKKHN